MTIYNVHIYRQMRLVLKGIAADSHEAAAASVRDKQTDHYDDIADCDGETIYACVDVQGNEGYEQSRWIDFEPERERKAAPRLRSALEFALEFLTANDDGEDDVRSRIASATSALAEADAAGIAPESPAPTMRAALTWLLDDLADASQDRDPNTSVEYDSVAYARAALTGAKTAPAQAAPTPAETEMYDTLRYVAEMLSGFKPDFLHNLGLDVAAEKTSAALDAFEASARTRSLPASPNPTPGQWHIEPLQEDEGKSIAICKIGRGIIAIIPPPEDAPFFTSQEDSANARLIAATPELLDALQETYALLDACMRNANRLTHYEFAAKIGTMISVNRRVIAKATGKNPWNTAY
jgi:hypothetical protein